LRPRVSARGALRASLAAARTGGAALGLALILSSPDPRLVLGFVGIAALVTGGLIRRHGPDRALCRMGISLAVVAMARAALGPAAAAITTALLALGAILHVGVSEGAAGLAVFAAVLLLLGGASVRLALAFLGLGFGVHLAARLRAWRHRTRARPGSLTIEKPPARPLAPES